MQSNVRTDHAKTSPFHPAALHSAHF
jgi:hypothetical protein